MDLDAPSEVEILTFDARQCAACRLLCKLLYIEVFSHSHVNFYPDLSDTERASINVPPPPVLMVDGEEMEETNDKRVLSTSIERLQMD